MTPPLANDVADFLQSRFYGKYRGVVTDVDPDTMRIKARVAAVLGSQDSGWCLPCVPYAGDGVGFCFLPENGTSVWIEFEGGDVSFPIWVGCFWNGGDAIPSDLTDTTRGIVTKSPHKLLFDDDAGSLTLEDSNDASLVLDSDGLTLTRGSTVKVASDGVSINDNSFKVT
jgi:uncharacterized protein involved in type VI secretion and phage assembly